MKAAGPVKSVLGLALSEDRGARNRAGGVADTVVIEPFHDWAVFLEVEPVELVFEIGLVFRSDIFQQINVLIGVKSGERFLLCMQVVQFGKFVVDGGEVIVEFILADDFVGHGDSQRLHGVAIRVVESADHLVEIVDAVFLELHFLYCLLI